MSLLSVVIGVVQTKANAGLKQNVQRLVPTATGALKRSVVIEVRQRHGGVALIVRLLGYHKYQKAAGVSGQLTQAIGKLLLQTLRDSLIEATQIHLFQQLRLWNLPLQSGFSQAIPGALQFQFKIFLLNNGRTR